MFERNFISFFMDSFLVLKAYNFIEYLLRFGEDFIEYLSHSKGRRLWK